MIDRVIDAPGASGWRARSTLVEWWAHELMRKARGDNASELLDKVWGSSTEWQDPSTVTVHIRRLRQKIETDPDNPTRITTVCKESANGS